MIPSFSSYGGLWTGRRSRMKAIAGGSLRRALERAQRGAAAGGLKYELGLETIRPRDNSVYAARIRWERPNALVV